MTGLKTSRQSVRMPDRRQTTDDSRPLNDSHLRIIQRQSDQEVFGGLCALCNLSTSCTFPRSQERPILSCEEFDGRGESIRLHVMGQAADPMPISKRPAEHPENASTRGVWGLCTTCVKRDSCEFPRYEGGVWQCEEFE